MVSQEIKAQLEDLNNRYVYALDGDRLEEWPKLFLENGIYKIVSRDNDEAGLTAYWMYFTNQVLMRDRVTSLREATVYNIHYDRHITGNMTVEHMGGDEYRMRTNFLYVQTDVEGNSELTLSGYYRDKIIFVDGEPKFQERAVVVDTFNPPKILATPI